MDRAMIDRWNATVGAADEVWHLGDFAVRRGASDTAPILDALRGRKHLIAGNNDGQETRLLPGWTSVADYRELELDGRRLVLCHYPFRSWNGMGNGALDLHGHSHGRLKPMARQADVGVDLWDFRPVTLYQLLAGIRSEEHTSELQSLMRISYAVFCLKKKNNL